MQEDLGTSECGSETQGRDTKTGRSETRPLYVAGPADRPWEFVGPGHPDGPHSCSTKRGISRRTHSSKTPGLRTGRHKEQATPGAIVGDDVWSGFRVPLAIVFDC